MKEDRGAVVSGFLWKFGERICAQLVSLVVSIVLARLLAPRAFGLVAMVNIFITIADVFVTDSLSSALIQKKDADQMDFDSVFWMTLALSFLIYGASFLIAPAVASFYGEPELVSVLRVFALKFPVSALNTVQHAYVSRHMIFRKFFFSTLIGTILSGIVGITMAYAGCGVWSLIAQYLTNSFVDSLVLFFTIPWRPRLEFSRRRAWSLFSYGWKILASSLLAIIYTQLRGLAIGKTCTADDLAHYNMGERIPTIFTSNVDSSIGSVLFPAMSNINDDREALRILTRKSMRLSAYVIFPIMAGLAIVSRPLVTLLLTEKWLPCVFFIRLFCLEKATSPISTANLQAIKALGRSDVLLKMEIIKKTVGIFAVLISIPFGLRAIACSGIIVALFCSLVNMIPNGKLLGYSIREQVVDMLSIFFLCIGMAVVAMITQAILAWLDVPIFISMLLTIVIGVAIYFSLSKMFGIPEYQDLIRMLRKFFGQSVRK